MANPRTGRPSRVVMTPALQLALAEYERRTPGNLAGTLTDGHWTADPADTCPDCGKCSSAVAERMHQQSPAHVAHLFGVSAADLRRVALNKYTVELNRRRRAEKAAAAEQAQLLADAMAYRALQAAKPA